MIFLIIIGIIVMQWKRPKFFLNNPLYFVIILWKETLFFLFFQEVFIFKFCFLLQAFDQDAEFHFKNRARQCDKSYWKEKFGTGELYAISSSGTGKNVCVFSRNLSLSWFAVFLPQPILLISFWNSNFFFFFLFCVTLS